MPIDNKTPQEKFNEEIEKFEKTQKKKMEIKEILDRQEGKDLANAEFELLKKEVETYLSKSVLPHENPGNSIAVSYGNKEYLLFFSWYEAPELKNSKLEVTLKRRISGRTEEPDYENVSFKSYNFGIDEFKQHVWNDGENIYFTDKLVGGWFDTFSRYIRSR